MVVVGMKESVRHRRRGSEHGRGQGIEVETWRERKGGRVGMARAERLPDDGGIMTSEEVRCRGRDRRRHEENVRRGNPVDRGRNRDR